MRNQRKAENKLKNINTNVLVSYLQQLVKFELKIPDLLSPLKILHKLNKTRMICWNTEASNE